MKILFLLKERNSYGGQYSVIESGLLNSAKMTLQALKDNFGIEGNLKVCVDGNSIDKEIHQNKPQIVVIEAIWVTPAKIKELVKLHPQVIFIIRIHSEIPFLANEGNSVEWCKEYSSIEHTYVAFNSERTKTDFINVTDLHFYYLPNIYEEVCDNGSFSNIFRKKKRIPKILDIGCFGAIRPMKNQLQQAVAAISFANKYNSHLYFHINTPRLEQGGQSVLKNLRSVFACTKHGLVEHDWLPREDFLDLITYMDCGMQVSMNESFNIVTADFVKMGVPIIVSESIDWMPEVTKVSTEETKDIEKGLRDILHYPKCFVKLSRKALSNYNKAAIKTWYNFLYD